MAELAAKLESFKPTMLYIRGSPGASPENIKGHLAPIYIANGPGGYEYGGVVWWGGSGGGCIQRSMQSSSSSSSSSSTGLSFDPKPPPPIPDSTTPTDKLADHGDLISAMEEVPLETVFLDAAAQEKCERVGSDLCDANVDVA